MEESQVFVGFEKPKSNYSKLPHSLIEALPLIDSLAEMKVILYVLRHTWGFQEYQDAKRITMDEFERGRKSKGVRLDSGINMVRNSIRDGIDRAVKHGFLIQESDGRDAGRQSFVYYLNILEDDTRSNVDPLPGQELTPCPSEVDPRSEKDTKKEKNNSAAKTAAPNLYPLAQAIAHVCGIDLDANKEMLLKEAKLLSRAKSLPPTPELIRQEYNGGGYWSKNWPGSTGQRPRPSDIRKTWGAWLAEPIKERKFAKVV